VDLSSSFSRSSYTYVKDTILDIWHEFPLILISGFFASLAFLASVVLGIFFDQPILTVVTFPFLLFPSFTGIFEITGQIARGYACGLKDFFKTFLRCYKRSVLLGLLVVLPYALALGTKAILNAYPGQVWLWVPLIVQGSGFVIGILTYVHAVSLISTYDFPLKKSIQVAWSLIARAPIASVGILVFLFLMIFPLQWTRFGLLPVVLGGWPMFASNLTLLILRQAKFEKESPVNSEK
jgi:hypothetical protein